MEKFSDLKNLGDKELKEKISLLRKESLNLRFQRVLVNLKKLREFDRLKNKLLG